MSITAIIENSALLHFARYIARLGRLVVIPLSLCRVQKAARCRVTKVICLSYHTPLKNESIDVDYPYNDKLKIKYNVYPKRDITNIVESSHYLRIGSWCRAGSTPGAQSRGKCKAWHWVKPFRCLALWSFLAVLQLSKRRQCEQIQKMCELL
ncbi:hypothetical protein NQ318_005945 [Aromia moschata]|uniref:E1 domain-containing protein n=1 Tax=Aromia moschata TaxID=1265417 RepID=A0AAV8YEW2_9CUCU|nr:hypothetical protein NQ318_005945 [Aromia moschata]